MITRKRPVPNYAFYRNQQLRARQSGLALRKHQATAHKGEFNQNCPACRELKQKEAKP